MATSGLAPDCGPPDHTIRAQQTSRPPQGKRLRVAPMFNDDVRANSHLGEMRQNDSFDSVQSLRRHDHSSCDIALCP